MSCPRPASWSDRSERSRHNDVRKPAAYVIAAGSRRRFPATVVGRIAVGYRASMGGQGTNPIRTLLFSTFVATASIAVAAPTDLDPAFGTDGIASIPTHSMARSVRAFGDGRLAVLVQKFFSQDRSTTVVVAVTRDGRTDPGFAPIEAVDVPDRSADIIGFAFDAAGHIVVLHQVRQVLLPFVSAVLTRHAPDGAVDASYAQGGRTRQLTSVRGGHGVPVLDTAGRPHFVLASGSVFFVSSSIGRVSNDGFVLDHLG